MPRLRPPSTSARYAFASFLVRKLFDFCAPDGSRQQARNVPDGDFSKATIAVTIDASSIDTGVAARDAHLKSPDFFDAAQYPELRFVESRVQRESGAGIEVVGDLTIKGTTREVVLRVEQHGQAKDPWGNVRAAFTAKTTIDRKDFGLTWNQALETGGVLVGDKIEIEAEIQAVKQVAAQVA